MSNLDMEKDIKETVDYLYKIEGDCSPELYRAIGVLRQLINEEFVGKDKTVSSQLIFDIISPAYNTEALQLADHLVLQGGFKSPKKVTAEIIAELERLWNKLPQAKDNRWYSAGDIDGLIQDRIKYYKAKETQL